jgi:hypothetical protein
MFWRFHRTALFVPTNLRAATSAKPTWESTTRSSQWAPLPILVSVRLLTVFSDVSLPSSNPKQLPKELAGVEWPPKE